jgi:ElaB/YqjD/DUF883 family membrane-anchored ribosome-binding protein
MNRIESIDEATKRAQKQIYIARLRAEKELERATQQANRAVEKSGQTVRQHPLMFGAIAGTAIIGGVAAWLFSRKRSWQ